MIFFIIDLESLVFRNRVKCMQQIVIQSFRLVLRIDINFEIVELTIFDQNNI